jgi:hypothetical protein
MKELRINPSQEGVKTPGKVISNRAELFNYKEVVRPREKAFLYFRTGALCHQLGYHIEDFEECLLDRLKLAKDWFFIDEWERTNIDLTMKWLRYFTEEGIFIVV